jgi:hypothetical protein
MQIPCVYIPGPAPAVSVANSTYMYIQVCGLVVSTLGLERRSLVRFRLMGRPLYIGLYGGEAGCLHLYHPAHWLNQFLYCASQREEPLVTPRPIRNKSPIFHINIRHHPRATSTTMHYIKILIDIIMTFMWWSYSAVSLCSPYRAMFEMKNMK